MQRLMDDSWSLDAERRVQLWFMKSSIFNGLLFGTVALAHGVLIGLPDRVPRSPRNAAVHFVAGPEGEPIAGELRLAGRWTLRIDDSGFGGLSALAIDRGHFVAISDSGVVYRFPRPGAGGVASIRDMPSGPGRAVKKAGRDSEALARDPGGRGWWVGFENGHELRLFDARFERTLEIVDLRSFGWRRNRGVEGLAVNDEALIIFPEAGGEAIRMTKGTLRRHTTAMDGRIGDATILADGRTVAVVRAITPFGLRSTLVVAGRDGSDRRTLATLPFDRFGNPEGIVVEDHGAGVRRIWMVTDNDFRRRLPTELIALDWKP
jgi:hypothetical protein